MAGKMKRDIEKFKQKALADADAVMESFILGLYGEIIRRTPVAAMNGGRARGSWELGTRLATDRRTKDGPKNKSGKVKRPSGLRNMARHSDKKPVYISSAIPYIVPLENGHSQQAPKGFMVRGSVLYVVSQFRKASS